MGVVILISAVLGSWRLTIPATAAAMITLLGPSLGVPALGRSQGGAWLSCSLGTLVLCIPILVKPLRGPELTLGWHALRLGLSVRHIFCVIEPG